jgi:hypothetical protein
MLVTHLSSRHIIYRFDTGWPQYRKIGSRSTQFKRLELNWVKWPVCGIE